MDDLISRQAAIDALNKRARDTFTLLSEYQYYLGALHDVADDIKQLPSAQPQRKKGKWIPDNNNYYEERYVCSVCKHSFKVDVCMGKPIWNYCPNCGADMRGDSDDIPIEYFESGGK